MALLLLMLSEQSAHRGQVLLGHVRPVQDLLQHRRRIAAEHVPHQAAQARPQDAPSVSHRAVHVLPPPLSVPHQPLLLQPLQNRQNRRVGALFPVRHPLQDFADAARPPFPKDRKNLEFQVRWLGVFLERFFKFSQFKRSCLPNAPKVGSGGSLSPRSDYRAPSDAEATAWLAQLDRIPDDEG